MSLKNLTEVFLFVNPLGATCYEAEKTILNFSNELDGNVRVRFVPLLNFYTIGKQMDQTKITGTSLEMRNKLYTDSYHASLAFQAASMQGKKKGQKFFLALQKSIVELKKDFSKEIVLEVALQANLDMEMFEEDVNSDFAKSAFTKDQKLAQEMAVKEAPSCVIFQNMDKDFGYRIESTITKQLLHGLCETQVDNPEIEETKSKYKFEMI